jgi:hypothetical protein
VHIADDGQSELPIPTGSLEVGSDPKVRLWPPPLARA